MFALPVRQCLLQYQSEHLDRLSSGMSLSMLPNIRSPTQRRPKLSLQTTSFPALSNLATIDSPTNRNTQVNAIVSSPRPKPATPQYSSVSDDSTIPYTLPIGARSILKNSPLPPRHVSAAPARTPRRMFPPVKRVLFRENPVEVMPTPLIEGPESSSDSDSSTSSQKRRRASMAEDTKARVRLGEGSGSATPVQGRSKRRREWVWTLDEESSSGYSCSSPDAGRILRDRLKNSKDGDDLLSDDSLSLEQPLIAEFEVLPHLSDDQDNPNNHNITTGISLQENRAAASETSVKDDRL